MEDVCVLIPTLNEEGAIGRVIDELHHENLNNILVIDGNSSDRTVEIARSKGARIISQCSKGKGNAIIEALNEIREPYIVMLDGDGTNQPCYAPRMIEIIKRHDCDHVIGNRLKNYEPHAFRFINLVGNKLFNKLFKVIYKKDFVDILSGYHVFTTESLKSLNLKSAGFEIETEIAVKYAKSNYKTKVIDTYYKARVDESKTKLNPIKDGWKILRMMLKASH